MQVSYVLVQDPNHTFLKSHSHLPFKDSFKITYATPANTLTLSSQS